MKLLAVIAIFFCDTEKRDVSNCTTAEVVALCQPLIDAFKECKVPYPTPLNIFAAVNTEQLYIDTLNYITESVSDLLPDQCSNLTSSTSGNCSDTNGLCQNLKNGIDACGIEAMDDVDGLCGYLEELSSPKKQAYYG